MTAPSRDRRIRSAVFLTVVVLVATACTRPSTVTVPIDDAPVTTTSTPQAPLSQTVPMGATVQIAAAAGSAAYTVGNWRAVPPEAQVIPAKGAMYSVDVTVEANTGTTTVNGFYFLVRTADGAGIAPAVGAVRPGISYSQLAQGQSVSGLVAFDLAPGTAVIGVALRDPGGRQLALWSVG